MDVLTKNSSYSIEVRSLVLAGLMTGKTATEISELYNIPQPTVTRWKQQIPELMRELEFDQREMIRLNLFNIIIQSQYALLKQIEVFSNTEWLAQRSAKSLTILHGVMQDKIIRLLEAFASTTSEDQGTDTGTYN